MKYFKILIAAIIFFPFSLLPQNVEFTKENFPNDRNGLKEAKKNIQEADGYFYQSQNAGYKLYSKALPLYLKANDFNPKNILINYQIGVCYLHSSFKKKSLSYLEKVGTLNPTIGENLHYYLGQSYHLNMDWDKAIQEYQTHKDMISARGHSDKPEQKAEILEVDKKIAECKNGMELVKKPIPVLIENLGSEINSSFPDYRPVISADESVLIFTSRRDNTAGGGVDVHDQMYYEDIYISTYENGKWIAAKNMGKPVNSENRHDATLALSADAQKLFIYLDDMDRGGGNIYQCNQKGTFWEKPEKMSHTINTKYHESSASLSADGNILYFVSNKAKGFGGHDIYKTEWDKTTKQWGESENLGTVINTPYEEHGVFIHPDGKTIYFSSEGHKTMGGFDIFKSVLDKKTKQWSTPENIGYPINTPDDDIDYVVSASGKHAYYSSFRADGHGEKDICIVTAEISSAEVTILKGTIFDALTKQPLEAEIELVDNQLNLIISTFTSNSATGKYLVSLPSGRNYGIAVSKQGYLFQSENLDIPASAAYQEIVKDFGLNSLSVGSKIVLKNIFFDFDKATLRAESASELERLTKLLTDAPTIEIEISGHTDNKGSDEYNRKLSQSRAQAVVDYLVKKGIEKSRFTAKGYGKTKPVATNDTDEGRQLNRRTEFEILSK
ncbi:MAG: hypothetical protein EPN85_03145 [Bacteroidetes bacterium]|nr:MAG: hypothetical protein EPN85_03145 [Bacteroidota bacterium]